MAKMVVLEVDLGQDIDDIINEDVEEMTEKTRQTVDDAINQKKQIDTERVAQAQLKLRKEQEIQDALGKYMMPCSKPPTTINI